MLRTRERYVRFPGKGRTPQSPGPGCPWRTWRPGPSDLRCSPRYPRIWSIPPSSARSATPSCRSSWTADPPELRWHWKPSRSHTDPEESRQDTMMVKKWKHTMWESFVAVNFCINLRAKAEGTNRTTEKKRIHPPAAPWPVYSELAPPVWQHRVKNVCRGAERTGCALMEGGRRGIGVSAVNR